MSVPEAPRATYRVQLHKDFTFDDAAALADYLADLGFSHLYCSPVMAARPGSTHGYDAIDHNRFNPELGGEEGFERMVAALQAKGLGLILDIVPNHVGVGVDNRAWMDVLEWGPLSPHALDFDIDWKSSRRNLEGKVLLPVLGDHFGVVLENGEIDLAFDTASGRISAWYFTNRLPISPLHYAALLAPALECLEAAAAERLASIVADFETLKQQADPRQLAVALQARLAEAAVEEPAIVDAINFALTGLDGKANDTDSWNALGELLDAQSYRAAYWRVSSDEINYRRFFDINELAGLRVERRELFDEMHRTVLKLVAENKVQGLRIDHIDGLYDPLEYAQRLQEAAGTHDKPAYILLEKILAHFEELPADWPVAGTTGYDTLNLVGGLFVDPESEAALSTLYRRFSGRREAFDDLLYDCKKRIVQVNLASEVGVLSNAMQSLSASHRRTRDFTYAAIRKALEDLIAAFPVYRTYLDNSGELSVADRRYLDWALAVAKKRAGPIDTSIFTFLASVLSGELAAEGSGYPRESVINAAMRFQQLSGPAMAKGLEDTSFYRYFRLLSHNEVGGDPRQFAVTANGFHLANRKRLEMHPLDMIGGSTHDTKRGEDARARIACLSGLVREWSQRVSSWARCNRRLIGEIGNDAAPDRNHQYYFYQTLIGAWPVDLAIDDASGLAELAERVDGALLKAVREGKDRSSWTHPNQAYEKALSAFVHGALKPGANNLFLVDFQPFAIRVAGLGALTSLSQTLLRLTMPGVPDTYRGAEVWELSMVDPDNRRPVDYAACRDKSASLPKKPKPAAVAELATHWQDGRVKLYLIRSVLRLRREQPLLFTAGRYRPLVAYGACADNVVAFERELDGTGLVVIAPRLWPQLLADAAEKADWADTRMPLPPGDYHDVLSGREHRVAEGAETSLADLLADFPAALLLRA